MFSPGERGGARAEGLLKRLIVSGFRRLVSTVGTAPANIAFEECSTRRELANASDGRLRPERLWIQLHQTDMLSPFYRRDRHAHSAPSLSWSRLCRARRSRRTKSPQNAIPETKPPMWAHQAIPPTCSGLARARVPLNNWLKNQRPK